jgi:hypothetical protein
VKLRRTAGVPVARVGRMIEKEMTDDNDKLL